MALCTLKCAQIGHISVRAIYHSLSTVRGGRGAHMEAWIDGHMVITLLLKLWSVNFWIFSWRFFAWTIHWSLSSITLTFSSSLRNSKLNKLLKRVYPETPKEWKSENKWWTVLSVRLRVGARNAPKASKKTQQVYKKYLSSELKVLISSEGSLCQSKRRERWADPSDIVRDMEKRHATLSTISHTSFTSLTGH